MLFRSTETSRIMVGPVSGHQGPAQVSIKCTAAIGLKVVPGCLHQFFVTARNGVTHPADEQGWDLAALVSPLSPSSMATTMDQNHSEDKQLQKPQECQTQPVFAGSHTPAVVSELILRMLASVTTMLLTSQGLPSAPVPHPSYLVSHCPQHDLTMLCSLLSHVDVTYFPSP